MATLENTFGDFAWNENKNKNKNKASKSLNKFKPSPASLNELFSAFWSNETWQK